MTKRSLFLAVFLIGCGGRVSLGEHGSGDNQLSSADSGEAPTDGGASGLVIPDAPVVDSGPAAVAIDRSEVDYIEDDESAAPTARKIRIYANCRVTDHTGLDAMADLARCKELFDVVLEPTTYWCGGADIVGTLRLHLKDGRDYVRDLNADVCVTKIPGTRAHKFTWAAWYSAGGG